MESIRSQRFERGRPQLSTWEGSRDFAASERGGGRRQYHQFDRRVSCFTHHRPSDPLARGGREGLSLNGFSQTD